MVNPHHGRCFMEITDDVVKPVKPMPLSAFPMLWLMKANAKPMSIARWMPVGSPNASFKRIVEGDEASKASKASKSEAGRRSKPFNLRHPETRTQLGLTC